MLSTRDPFPHPRYQNDNDFMGKPVHRSQHYDLPTHLEQNRDPWHRLNTTHTYSGLRKDIFSENMEAPRDSLDFHLRAEYNQHREFLKEKNETVVQPETIGKYPANLWYAQSMHGSRGNRYKSPQAMEYVDYKRSPHSVKNAILGHHTQCTNCGYSRKPDGGFYTS